MPGLMQKFKDLWNPPEEEYDNYDYEEDASEEEMEEEPPRGPRSQQRPAGAPHRRQPAAPHTGAREGGKVVNLNAASTQLQVVVFKPQHFGEETCAVADELLHGNTVVLNLEDTQKDISRRIIDFLSGVAYANGGKIKRVATSTFIITPYNVDLMGEDAVTEQENSGEYF